MEYGILRIVNRRFSFILNKLFKNKKKEGETGDIEILDCWITELYVSNFF